MALATLNGLPIPHLDPPWNLQLSHSSSLDTALPTEALCAQFAKSSAKTHPLLEANAQDIFRWFRPVGPLVTVRADVDVGYPKRTCVIQYWDEKHATAAFKSPQGLHPDLLNMPQFVLRTFAPCSVFVSVSQCFESPLPPSHSFSRQNLGSNFHLPDVDELFGPYGTVIQSVNCPAMFLTT